MHPNSIKIYKDKIEPNLSEREYQVLTALQELTQGHVYDIAEKLNLPVNSVSGRLTALSNRQLIVADGYKLNKFNNNCTLWKPAA